MGGTPLLNSNVLGYCRESPNVDACLLLGGFKDAISRSPGWRRCKCETMAGWDGPSVIPITHITAMDEGIGRGSGTQKLVTSFAMSI